MDTSKLTASGNGMSMTEETGRESLKVFSNFLHFCGTWTKFHFDAVSEETPAAAGTDDQSLERGRPQMKQIVEKNKEKQLYTQYACGVHLKKSYLGQAVLMLDYKKDWIIL
ncbi:hypothetical protein AV530_005689 [Patagioenas fasciata monilis]|uniref:Uncharacterized protein n=1 Tax=Patagioenas fasciata monilis TaxID=372326 RepID=A0A1V4JNK9_PATFA|nr:hypothetical protein AV530_005689 [Patagioenas fasciata monilis]